MLSLVIYPDPRLKKISEPVKHEEINNDFRLFLQQMLETMYENKGLGLAAVQVGVLKRVIAMDIAQGSIRYDGTHNPEAIPDPIFLINPEITKVSEEKFVFEEGCLSFPTQFADVERPKKVTVSFLDSYGKPKEIEFEGLAAVCIQHEIDHLNGIVFVDHISKLIRDRITKKTEKIKKQLQQ